MKVETRIGHWPLKEPFEIARGTMLDVGLVDVVLTDTHGFTGRAEAAGVDYDGETPETIAAQIDALGPTLDDDLTHEHLAHLLPIGGARNALDCALWDLEAKRSGTPVAERIGMPALQPVVTTCTIGLGTREEVAARAKAAHGLPLVKIKLDAVRHSEWVQIIRHILPNARLIVDANQAWTLPLLESLMPSLETAGVELIEQPLPRGQDRALAGFASPIPIAADESCTDRASLAVLEGRYQAINIKLDKCGGLTEALAMAGEAKQRGFDIMVGNMCGTSLGMAPALLVAQHARWADLDGPLLLSQDRTPAMTFTNGIVQPPPAALWG